MSVCVCVCVCVCLCACACSVRVCKNMVELRNTDKSHGKTINLTRPSIRCRDIM